MAELAVVVVQALHKMKKTSARFPANDSHTWPILVGHGSASLPPILDSFFLRHHVWVFGCQSWHDFRLRWRL
jgi:hypothetical protein